MELDEMSLRRFKKEKNVMTIQDSFQFRKRMNFW